MVWPVTENLYGRFSRMTRLSDFSKAKAGDWIAETFERPTVSGGVGVFELTGTSTGYTAFGDHFDEGDVVFYAAFDDACNRECGFATFSKAGPVPTLTPIESNATLANGQLVDGDVKPIAFPKGGTITGTFNSEAFNALWTHIWDKENPHDVQAYQVDQNNDNGLGDTVQDALDTLLRIVKAIEISEDVELEVLLGMLSSLQKDIERLEWEFEQEKFYRVEGDQKLQDQIDLIGKEESHLEELLAQEIEDRISGDDLLRDEINALEGDLAQEVTDRIEGDKALQGQIDKEVGDRIEGDKNLQSSIDQEIIDRTEADKLLRDSIDDLTDDLAQEIVDRQKGDSALGKRIDGLELDDLADVNAANAKIDQFLIHNGVQWVVEDFHIDTELTFGGGISVPNDPAPAANNGDLYINNESGVAGASWTGIAGRTINMANAVGWSEKNARWYILGDIASASVMRVEAGLGIDVDNATKPAEPVVSIDRAEVDKWYEPKFSKNTAFNKNFGTTAGTVAEGNHDHDADYSNINHNHDGVYEPVFAKNTAFNKSFGTAAGTVAEGNHNHDTRYSDINHNHNGVYEPVFTKNTAFNKNFGATAGTVSEGNHTHSQYITSFTETDPTVPAHVKAITQSQINKWDSPAAGVDLTGYATESWVSTNYQPKGSYLTSADLTGYATQSWVTGQGYATQSWVTNQGYLTSASLNGYATQSWVQGQGYLTSASLSGYATETWVSTNYQPKGSYLTSFTESDPTVPAHVKGITQADINKWNNPPSGGGGLPDGDWHCTGSITAAGNITAYSTSDERLKDDITAMPVGLIDGINPVTWKWKEGGKKSGGVVAQQLEQCGLGNWVHEAPDGTLGVDYNALIGVLLSEVKSLKDRVKELEK